METTTIESRAIAPFVQLTIFDEIRTIIRQCNATDLATGNPNFPPPQFLKDFFKEQIAIGDCDQYGALEGNIQLRQKIAEIYSQEFNKNSSITDKYKISATENVLITLGATGAIVTVCNAFLDEGDEVVVLDPQFYHHLVNPLIQSAVVRACRMIPPNSESAVWQVDFETLRTLFNAKTKLIILNSPHNPTGKIFTKQEYEKIAEILEDFPRVVVCSDEVYDFLCYDRPVEEFQRFATISDKMFARTITLGSLGKAFSCTGYRTGYAIAPKPIMKSLVAGHQHITARVFHPVQPAFARALETGHTQPFKGEKSYFAYTCKKFLQHCDALTNLFQKFQDIKILPIQGGYFLLLNIRNYVPKIPLKYFYNKKQFDKDEGQIPCGKSYEELDCAEVTPDLAFTMYCVQQFGVAVTPLSSFYYNADNRKSDGIYLVRVALSKKMQTIGEAAEKLKLV